MWRSVALPAALAGLAAFSTGASQEPPSQSQAGSRSATYSILGHDPVTGEFGVASASGAPLIGVNLDFFDPAGGGVVVHGGPHLAVSERILIALRDGVPADRAISVGLVIDPDRERRQVLAISRTGAAAFTGRDTEKHAAQEVSELFVAAGHRLASDTVVPAISAAFENSDGPLADRLLGALEAGRDAGGEKDGARSAALLVVGPGAQFATRGRLVDLRIDFEPGDAVAALASLRARVDSVYGVFR